MNSVDVTCRIPVIVDSARSINRRARPDAQTTDLASPRIMVTGNDRRRRNPSQSKCPFFPSIDAPIGRPNRKTNTESECERTTDSASYFVLPYTEIGSLFGGRDHSTVIHSVNKVEAEMAADPEYRLRVESLRDTLSGG